MPPPTEITADRPQQPQGPKHDIGSGLTQYADNALVYNGKIGRWDLFKTFSSAVNSGRTSWVRSNDGGRKYATLDTKGLGEALGGQWQSNEVFDAWLTDQRRDDPEVTKVLYDAPHPDHGLVRFEARRARYDATSFYVNPATNFWVPQLESSVSAGQKFLVNDSLGPRPDQQREAALVRSQGHLLGEDFVDYALTHPDKADIVTAQFYPNGEASWHGKGGRATLVYAWRRGDGLRLESVGAVGLGEQGEPEMRRTHGLDAEVMVGPFGVFGVPGELDESEFALNAAFPVRAPRYNPDGGSPLDDNINAINIFGITQISTGR